MIPFQEAYNIVVSKTNPLGKTEEVALSQSTGRILLQDVISDINMPPFRKTAVDGFAC